MRKTVITFLGLLFVVTGLAQETALKPRLVVFTDIAPADVEPDDMESMVRLMAYADRGGTVIPILRSGRIICIGLWQPTVKT